MTTAAYSLDEFVSDMESLLKGQPDQQRIFDRGSTHLSRLIGNPESIPAEYRAPVAKGSRANHGSYLLYHVAVPWRKRIVGHCRRLGSRRPCLTP